MLRFFEQALRSPKKIGAIAASSNGLSHAITDAAQLQHANHVMELGPGTGVFTKKIIEKKSQHAPFFAIEINAHFVQRLKKHHPQCTVYHDDCNNMGKYLQNHDIEKTDRIISGLPWTAFEENLQRKLLTEIKNNLSDEGIFVTFSYYPLTYLRSGRRFKSMLENNFTDVSTTKIIWMNVPPAFVYVCKH